MEFENGYEDTGIWDKVAEVLQYQGERVLPSILTDLTASLAIIVATYQIDFETVTALLGIAVLKVTLENAADQAA